MNSNRDDGKVCALCSFSIEIPGTGDMLCRKKGVVPKEHHCRKFLYDPLKRKPRKMPELSVPSEFMLGDIIGDK
jgi:ribosomal protein L24E